MNRAPAAIWTALIVGTVAYLAALGWLTRALLQAERLRAQADDRAVLRLALWRMESWFAPRLVRESSRPYFEWLAYYPQQRAYDRMHREIVAGEVQTPSPLLTFESALLPLHFQWTEADGLTSPQVPRGNLRDLAESTLVDPQRTEVKARILARLQDACAAGWRPDAAHALLAQPAAEERTARGEDGADDDGAADAMGDESWDLPVPESRRGDEPVLLSAAEPMAEKALPGDLRRRAQRDAAPEPARSGAGGGAAGGAPMPGSASGGQATGPPPADAAEATRSARAAPRQTADPIVQRWLSEEEQQRRVTYLAEAQLAVPPAGMIPESMSRGVRGRRARAMTATNMVPLWIELPCPEGAAARVGHDCMLAAIRRVDLEDGVLWQGVLIDWETLLRELSPQVGDLPGAHVVAIRTDDDARRLAGSMLAGLPVGVEMDGAPPALLAGPLAWTLGLVWFGGLSALAIAAAAVGIALRYGAHRARFASAVTHELRTPLTTFRLYTEMLDEGLVREEQVRRSYIRTLRTESNRLALLVGNVLSYARLERGGEQDRRRRITVDGLLEEIGPALRARAQEVDAACGITIDGEDRGVTVMTDVESVRQILVNLVDNACKYGVTGADRRIEISARVRAGVVEIDVRDHGPGVEAARRTTIFQPFDRGTHRDDTAPGVGLGLALARGLARRLGGGLTLVDVPGGGACFRLSLPT
ncbi:MAG: hypothetical protein KF817_03050 [Phycisphaeraceae bacterium]|nr:hypothetical protein [Phycisphaeraceae bacterium]